MYFWRELFDSIAPQNAEIHTVTNSLPLNLKNSAKSLFFNRLSHTDENLKYNLHTNEKTIKLNEQFIISYVLIQIFIFSVRELKN